MRLGIVDTRISYVGTSSFGSLMGISKVIRPSRSYSKEK